jgi:glycosyltransferase involved in cell wall biosynthesis
VNVLVVLAQAPEYEGGAPGRCAVGLIRGLLKHGVEVRAVAAVPENGAPLIPSDLDVELVEVPSATPGLRGHLGRLRRSGGELASGRFAARVQDLSADADVVHFEQTATAALAEQVRRPAVVHVHYRTLLDRPLLRPWGRDTLGMIEFAWAERRAIRLGRHFVASSPVVAASIRRGNQAADVTTAPLTLDPLHYRQAAPADAPPIAGIVGTGSWPVTARAMRRLVHDVWPSVREQVPGARLVVAGRELVDARLRTEDGVELTGEVDSAADFLAQLAVLVYPLRFGSGMKVKVLEALACGLPVVTTPAGAEGISAGDGVVIAEDDREIAARTISILKDAGERSARGAAARDAFLTRYAPRPATAPLVDLYVRIRG